jgi:hypothetical protein
MGEMEEMPEHDADVAETIRYLRAPDFVDNVARVASEKPFRTVGVVAEMPDAENLEFRLHGADGTVGPWQVLEPEWREGGYRTATLFLHAPTSSIELRAALAPSYVRLELSEEDQLFGDHEGALVEDEGGEARAARPGMWQPPASTLAIGDTQYIPYVGATGCSSVGTLLPGTRDIADMLRASFPGATSYGGYNCRKISGTNTWSVHSTGRAIDLFVTLSGGQADNDLGDPIANWLIEHSNYLGISLVIWDRASWGPHRTPGAKHRYYDGDHPHHDHLHIEVSQTAANRGTQWFADGKPGPGGGGGGGPTCRPKVYNGCSGADQLAPGRVLSKGQSVTSCDGRFQLAMQTDGNLVMYQRNVGALWHTHTYGTNADRAVMQTDGNFVVYGGSTPLWNTGTWGKPGASTFMQSDGNIVTYHNGVPVWSSGTQARPTPACSSQWLASGQALTRGQSRTSCDGRYTLAMQTDGNLVLYQRNVGAVWHTHTHNTAADRAVMQTDGNFVVYAGATPLWHTHTYGHAGAQLAVQSDGNLVVYGGSALWWSGTNECN